MKGRYTGLESRASEHRACAHHWIFSIQIRPVESMLASDLLIVIIDLFVTKSPIQVTVSCSPSIR